MSEATRRRTQWECPECGRSYQLRAGRETPELCKQCIRRNERAAAKAAKAQRAESQTPNKEGSNKPTVASSIPLTSTVPNSAPGKLPPEVEAHIAAQERKQLLADVANISRTMTFFRRLVWGMVFLMGLNFLLMGVAFFYSMSQISSVGNLLNGVGDAAVGGGQPGGGQEQVDPRQAVPGLDQKLQPIKDYADTLNELLEQTK